MGNDSSESGLTSPSVFLEHRDAEKIFGKLDYLLKDGIHIQNVPTQFEYYKFLEENHDSLRSYYTRYFDVLLENGGEGNQRYFYLEFNGANRGKIDNRYFLKSEYVIIGFLIYKITIIDGNFELTSIKKLQTTIKRDYEELRPGIYKLLAKIKKETVTQLNDDKVDEIILNALMEFQKIGWVTLDRDYFDTLPSFQRLVKIYGDYINNIDEWINQQNR